MGTRALEYHLRDPKHDGHSHGLCGQNHTWNYTWLGWTRDKRHTWCQKCLDLEPLYELSNTDL